MKNCLSRKSQYPEIIHKPFRRQKCLRRKSSLSWNYSKSFSPAKLSQMQIIIILKTFEDFFACNIVVDANHRYPENIQRLFRLQKCLRRKSSLSWNYSKSFSPAKLSQMQIIIILKTFEDFFAIKIVLDAYHYYPENFQRTFRLQNCLSRETFLSWKHSKTFSLEKNVLAAINQYPENIQKTFRLQKCLRHKSSLSWRHSKIFRLQNCLTRKSSLSRKYSKIFSPARLSWPQTIFMLKLFKGFFACKIVLAANHHYPEKSSKTFSSAKTVLAASHLYPEKIQRLFRLQNCLSRKSSISWENSKTFSPAKLSYSQFIITLRNFKDFFACNIVIDANHHYPENNQKLFRLQNCFRRKSSLSWKHSKTFSPEKMF